MSEPKALTVTECNEVVSSTLSETFTNILVEGEITGLKVRQNRWISFDLKDATSILPCFGVVGQIPLELLSDGAVIRIGGSPRLYVPYGKYSFSVRSVEAVGEGALRKAFELLKQKLETEGLFAPERKRSLPLVPTTIGLITSRDGAVIHDIQRTLLSRWGRLKLILAPVPVQGRDAATAVVNAIQYFNSRQPVDVLVIARGGGSYEDLAAFNDESLARAIVASRIPTVSAIGHESDVTIADLVADRRAPTPTAAAQMVVPDKLEFEFRLNQLSGTMSRSIRSLIERQRHDLTISTHRFRHFFGTQRNRIDDLNRRLRESLPRLTERRQHQLDQLSVRIRSLDPTRILKQGYAMLSRPDGSIIDSIVKVTIGEQLHAQLKDGLLETWVMAKKEGNYDD